MGGGGVWVYENRKLEENCEGGVVCGRIKLEINNILSPIREGSKNTLREEGRVLIFPQSLAISVSPLLKVPFLKT